MTNIQPEPAVPQLPPAQAGTRIQPVPLESTCSVSLEQLRAAERVVAREVRKAQALHKPPGAETPG